MVSPQNRRAASPAHQAAHPRTTSASVFGARERCASTSSPRASRWSSRHGWRARRRRAARWVRCGRFRFREPREVLRVRRPARPRGGAPRGGPRVAPADDVRRGRPVPRGLRVRRRVERVPDRGGRRRSPALDVGRLLRRARARGRRAARHPPLRACRGRHQVHGQSGGEALPPLPVLAAAAEPGRHAQRCRVRLLREDARDGARRGHRAVRHAAPLGFARGDVHIPQSIRERRRNVTLACPARVSRGGLARSRVRLPV